MTTDKKIRIEFEIKDVDKKTGVVKEVRRYEAVSFLEDIGTCVDGKEMFRCTSMENGGVIGEDDEQFLYDNHSGQIPPELESYWLVTGKYNSGRPTFISCFNRYERRRWVWLGIDFDAKFLVLRRLPPLTQT